ncbi:MAG: hypothetical protein H7Y42_03475 [Chitinophagaceae bacterium]|nr:hypothetical protein [Chitinophagaceae bacterium]
MNKKLLEIQQKIGSIQFGLLRIRNQDDEKTTTLQVKTTANEDNSLNCVVTDDAKKDIFINRNVNLIQKSHNDYLYITGQVADEVNQKGKILSIRILKACWFVRKRKGSVSWLQEKYIYENLPQEGLDMAS